MHLSSTRPSGDFVCVCVRVFFCVIFYFSTINSTLGIFRNQISIVDEELLS